MIRYVKISNKTLETHTHTHQSFVLFADAFFVLVFVSRIYTFLLVAFLLHKNSEPVNEWDFIKPTGKKLEKLYANFCFGERRAHTHARAWERAKIKNELPTTYKAYVHYTLDLLRIFWMQIYVLPSPLPPPRTHTQNTRQLVENVE